MIIDSTFQATAAELSRANYSTPSFGCQQQFVMAGSSPSLKPSDRTIGGSLWHPAANRPPMQQTFQQQFSSSSGPSRTASIESHHVAMLLAPSREHHVRDPLPPPVIGYPVPHPQYPVPHPQAASCAQLASKQQSHPDYRGAGIESFSNQSPALGIPVNSAQATSYATPPFISSLQQPRLPQHSRAPQVNVSDFHIGHRSSVRVSDKMESHDNFNEQPPALRCLEQNVYQSFEQPVRRDSITSEQRQAALFQQDVARYHRDLKQLQRISRADDSIRQPSSNSMILESSSLQMGHADSTAIVAHLSSSRAVPDRDSSPSCYWSGGALGSGYLIRPSQSCFSHHSCSGGERLSRISESNHFFSAEEVSFFESLIRDDDGHKEHT